MEQDLSPSLKILVVDDQEANIRLVEAILAPQGYQVIPAPDAERRSEEHTSELQSQR